MSGEPSEDEYDEETGRELAYCPSCDQYRPVTFQYTERITGAATLDLGGVVNPTKVMTNSRVQKHCAVCGSKSYNRADFEAMQQADRDEKTQTVVFVIGGLLIAMVLVALWIKNG